jgi:hypothetical protein
MLEKTYGMSGASEKLAAARVYLAASRRPDPVTFVPPPMPSAVVESAVVQPVVKPDFSGGIWARNLDGLDYSTLEPEPDSEPEPIVDERRFATEAPAPVAE